LADSTVFHDDKHNSTYIDPNYSNSLTSKSILLQEEINLCNEEKKMPTC